MMTPEVFGPGRPAAAVAAMAALAAAREALESFGGFAPDSVHEALRVAEAVRASYWEYADESAALARV